MVSKKQQVWDKAKPIRGRNPDAWRKDEAGKKMRFGSYGQEGEHGWEVHHKKPQAKGGSDDLGNLQPLHWKTHDKKPKP